MPDPDVQHPHRPSSAPAPRGPGAGAGTAGSDRRRARASAQPRVAAAPGAGRAQLRRAGVRRPDGDAAGAHHRRGRRPRARDLEQQPGGRPAPHPLRGRSLRQCPRDGAGPRQPRSDGDPPAARRGDPGADGCGLRRRLPAGRDPAHAPRPLPDRQARRRPVQAGGGGQALHEGHQREPRPRGRLDRPGLPAGRLGRGRRERRDHARDGEHDGPAPVAGPARRRGGRGRPGHVRIGVGEQAAAAADPWSGPRRADADVRAPRRCPALRAGGRPRPLG